MSELEKKIIETRFKFLHGLNPELLELEIEGFLRGKSRGKTMNVSINDVYDGLDKQIMDFRLKWNEFQRHRLREKQKLISPKSSLSDIPALKRYLADLRNIAGCMFLKLQELEKSR